MNPKYKCSRYQLFLGKSEKVLRTIKSNSVHSIVCDPPYELGFMGKHWDGTGIAYSTELWKEVMRVLKPGGYLLAFSGSRTYHRMVCAIEDAGFEIRDQIMWLYGSGFPKSQNVGKAIDKAAGAERKIIGLNAHASKRTGHGKSGVLDTRGPGLGGIESAQITAPATDAARQWEGWGTALKPAHEPICVARKPFKGTVASNVLNHRTGALNIDACRVGTDEVRPKNSVQVAHDEFGTFCEKGGRARSTGSGANHSLGRWPANVIHDGSDEVVAAFPSSKDGVAGKRAAKNGDVMKTGLGAYDKSWGGFGGSGSNARFFYCAKASKKDREDGNVHPTVKPTELMRYLVRLVTPPNGIVLDPFMGSGSTGKAAMLEGLKFAGIDMTPEYVEISRARIKHARKVHDSKSANLSKDTQKRITKRSRK